MDFPFLTTNSCNKLERMRPFLLYKLRYVCCDILSFHPPQILHNNFSKKQQLKKMAMLNHIFSINHASMRIVEIVIKTMNDDWRWFHMTKKKVKTEFWTEHMNSSINLKKLREIKLMVAEQKISNKWTCSMQVKGYDQTRKATIILLAYNSIHIPLTLCFLQSPSIWVNTYLWQSHWDPIPSLTFPMPKCLLISIFSSLLTAKQAQRKCKLKFTHRGSSLYFVFTTWNSLNLIINLISRY